MKVKEIIVVEGKSDTVAIKRALDADTIETNGSAISDETIAKIKLAAQTRGVIILTDPDVPGRKIRQTIIEHVPGCKHAFLSKSEALADNKAGLGVEHATPEVIKKALSNAQQMKSDVKEQITKDDLITAGLIGQSDSRQKRAELGKILKIGYTNGKQLHKRLMMFEIPKQVFIEAVSKLNEGDSNE